MNAILNHKFFLYGIIFLSLLTLINFYRAQSFACLGVFGIAYYLACLYMKNKGLCLLFAIAVSTIILGCEKNLEAMRNNCEGNGNDDEDCEVPVEDTFSGGMREGMESKKKKKTTPTDPNAPTTPTVPNPPTTPTVPNPPTTTTVPNPPTTPAVPNAPPVSPL